MSTLAGPLVTLMLVVGMRGLYSGCISVIFYGLYRDYARAIEDSMTESILGFSQASGRDYNSLTQPSKGALKTTSRSSIRGSGLVWRRV